MIRLLLQCLLLVSPLFARPLDIGGLKEYMDEDIARYLEQLTPEDMRTLQEARTKGSPTKAGGELKSQSPDLYERVKHFREVMDEKLNSLGEEARSFMFKSIAAFQQAQSTRNMSEVLNRAHALTEEYKNLSKEAQVELTNTFMAHRPMKMSGQLRTLNLPLTEEEQRIVSEVDDSKSDIEKLEEIRKKSPELYNKLIAFNNTLFEKINSMSDEPRLYMLKQMEVLEEARRSNDPSAYRTALASVSTDASKLSESARKEIASLLAPSLTNSNEMLDTAMKRMHPSFGTA